MEFSFFFIIMLRRNNVEKISLFPWHIRTDREVKIDNQRKDNSGNKDYKCRVTLTLV